MNQEEIWSHLEQLNQYFEGDSLLIENGNAVEIFVFNFWKNSNDIF